MKKKAKAKLLDLSGAYPGQTLIYKKQKYEVLGVSPYVKRDGTEIESVEVQSHCAKCGLPFTFFRSRHRPPFYPNRRCEKHVLETRRIRRIAAPKTLDPQTVFD